MYVRVEGLSIEPGRSDLDVADDVGIQGYRE